MKTFQESDIAFVTGAGSGIGRATCQLLAEQGATVVAADINKKSADETVHTLRGKNHLSIQLDVGKKDQVGAAVTAIIKRYSSPPTISVNCAGLFMMGPLTEITEDKYNTMFDVNVKGQVWVTQAVCKELLSANKKGSIVNISSAAKKGEPMFSIYTATKGAVESFTFSAAKEFGPNGIRVNVVSPGLIDTPMVANLPDEMKNMYTERIPLKRAGKAEEIAAAIVFVASEKASYVNGASITVDGGYS